MKTGIEPLHLVVEVGGAWTLLGAAKAKMIKELSMQLAAETVAAVPTANFPAPDNDTARETQYSEYKIIRRNGAVVGFEPAKISIAVTKAFLAVTGGTGAASARVREQVVRLTDAVVHALVRRQPSGGTFHIEDIQDQVELALMRAGEHNVARAYVLYREDRARERAKQREKQQTAVQAVAPVINVTENGVSRPLDVATITALVS